MKNILAIAWSAETCFHTRFGCYITYEHAFILRSKTYILKRCDYSNVIVTKQIWTHVSDTSRSTCRSVHLFWMFFIVQFFAKLQEVTVIRIKKFQIILKILTSYKWSLLNKGMYFSKGKCNMRGQNNSAPLPFSLTHPVVLLRGWGNLLWTSNGTSKKI